jgi:hypothetical protein
MTGSPSRPSCCLCCGWGGLGSLLAVIFGWTSSNAAHRAHRRSSALGDWGLGLGILGLIGAVIFYIAIAVAASRAGQPVPCDSSNVNWPYC